MSRAKGLNMKKYKVVQKAKVSPRINKGFNLEGKSWTNEKIEGW